MGDKSQIYLFIIDLYIRDLHTSFDVRRPVAAQCMEQGPHQPETERKPVIYTIAYLGNEQFPFETVSGG